MLQLQDIMQEAISVFWLASDYIFYAFEKIGLSSFRVFLVLACLILEFPVLFLFSVVQFWKMLFSYLFEVIIFVAFVVCNYVLL